MRLTIEDKALLQLCVCLGTWHVDAGNIVSAGRLVGVGYLRPIDDYEGIRVASTDDGVRAAMRAKIVVKNAIPLEMYQRDYSFTGNDWIKDQPQKLDNAVLTR